MSRCRPATKQDKGAAGRVQSAIDQLLDMQRADGNFGLWAARGDEAQDWLSVYALDFLTAASAKQYQHPDRCVRPRPHLAAQDSDRARHRNPHAPLCRLCAGAHRGGGPARSALCLRHRRRKERRRRLRRLADRRGDVARRRPGARAGRVRFRREIAAADAAQRRRYSASTTTPTITARRCATGPGS